MAGDDAHVDESKFTGFKKYYNSETIRGRANVAKVTYALMALGGLYLYFRKKPSKESASK